MTPMSGILRCSVRPLSVLGEQRIDVVTAEVLIEGSLEVIRHERKDSEKLIVEPRFSEALVHFFFLLVLKSMGFVCGKYERLSSPTRRSAV